MFTKRKQQEPVLSEIQDSEAAVHSLIERFGLTQFQDNSSGLEGGTGVSFPKVTYEAVAPLVGLDAYKSLADIKTFEIHRSRIPTDLFKSVVMDMDVMLMQYGSLPEHKTEEARSRFFSPVKMLGSCQDRYSACELSRCYSDYGRSGPPCNRCRRCDGG